MNTTLHPTLAKTIAGLDLASISNKRKELLQPLISFIQSKLEDKEEINLNFICTHNSRRSQFAQLWAQTAAYYYEIDARCYSGGVEITAFNKRAVAAIKRAGFEVDIDANQINSDNPTYEVSFSNQAPPLPMFSKLFNDSSSPSSNFAAVMTCSHAEKNCPFIPGTEARIPLLYEDPKAFDGTALEVEKYNERLMQIATELFYVFSQTK